MSATIPRHEHPSKQGRSVNGEEEIQVLLDALTDETCRTILAATSDGLYTAQEIADDCDLPLSTTYRKLESLTDAGLLTERTRIRRSGCHTSEYTRSVEDVEISIDSEEGTELTVSHREEDAGLLLGL